MKKVSEHRCFGGRQLRFFHRARSLSCDMHFSIYLPPQAQRERVPVLYWLSGLTCTDENFVTKAGAQRYAAEHGVAVVAPDTSPRGGEVPDDPEGAYDVGLGAGFYVNATQAPWSKHYQMDEYICVELPYFVEQHFPVSSSQVGIFGHSMGGHGALTIALRNPGKFRSVSAFAPIVSPMRCPWGQKALGNYLGDDHEQWRRYDTTQLLDTASPIPMLVDQGEADDFLEEQLRTELLLEALERTGYTAEVRMQPGYDHSYFFIASFIEDHIRFHSTNLR